MLQIINACIAFGDNIILSDFNMQLNKGEIACITGESGCGKTSLLNAVMGFVPLQKGQINIADLEVNKTNIDIIRKNIAWIPQELALPQEWVKEMIELPFELKANRTVTFSEEKLFECFEELGLDKMLYYKRVGEVSGGQRQRIMIAVAAMLKKNLIIIDEPTSALDAGSTDKVLSFFQKQSKQGSAVLAVTHDKSFANGCDHIFEL